MEYDTLNIRFQPAPGGSYTVIASSPRGDAPGEFHIPFADLDLENFVLRVGRPRRGVRRLDSPEMETAKTFGGKLFDALFSGDVRDLYHAASAEADSAGRGLRVTLRLTQAPDLSNIPWEYLCEEGRFLSVSERTPIVRYLDLKKAHTPLTIAAPLRILGMVSSPSDVVELNVEEEKRRLDQSLKALVTEGQLEVVWLEQATLGALLKAVERYDFHVFHYIGHGAFDEREGDGVLLLEDGRGRGMPVTGMKLGQLLADERTLRLAVLNACEGARTDREDPFAGVAASLVSCEIPSVVAMQFEITDEAAILFAAGLYGALARGSPVDAALASARKAIWADYNDIEWGTPVLFMRVPDGQIFDFSLATEVVDEHTEAEPRLHVSLEPSLSTVKQGETVTWRLTILNESSTVISGITVLQDDGSTLEAGAELEPGRRSIITWRSQVDRDSDRAITVRAVDGDGNTIIEQVTAHVVVEEVERSESIQAGEAGGNTSEERLAPRERIGSGDEQRDEDNGGRVVTQIADLPIEELLDDEEAVECRDHEIETIGDLMEEVEGDFREAIWHPFEEGKVARGYLSDSDVVKIVVGSLSSGQLTIDEARAIFAGADIPTPLIDHHYANSIFVHFASPEECMFVDFVLSADLRALTPVQDASRGTLWKKQERSGDLVFVRRSPPSILIVELLTTMTRWESGPVFQYVSTQSLENAAKGLFRRTWVLNMSDVTQITRRVEDDELGWVAFAFDTAEGLVDLTFEEAEQANAFESALRELGVSVISDRTSHRISAINLDRDEKREAGVLAGATSHSTEDPRVAAEIEDLPIEDLCLDLEIGDPVTGRVTGPREVGIETIGDLMSRSELLLPGESLDWVLGELGSRRMSLEEARESFAETFSSPAEPEGLSIFKNFASPAQFVHGVRFHQLWIDNTRNSSYIGVFAFIQRKPAALIFALPKSGFIVDQAKSWKNADRGKFERTWIFELEDVSHATRKVSDGDHMVEVEFRTEDVALLEFFDYPACKGFVDALQEIGVSAS